MAKTTINGGCVYMTTITDICRGNRGDASCVEIVMNELKRELEKALDRTQIKQGWKIHVAMSVERPQPHGGIGDDEP